VGIWSTRPTLIPLFKEAPVASAVETQTLYSRPVLFSESQARPGDQINIANPGREPYWQTLIEVVACTDENAEGYDCDGGCALVLHMQPGPEGVEGGDPEFWHVDWADLADVQTRLPLDGAR
jgi:hypothetical protein